MRLRRFCPLPLTSGENMIKYVGYDGVKPKTARTRERGEWKPSREAVGRAAPERSRGERDVCPALRAR